MDLRQFLIDQICKHNPNVDKKKAEKVLSKYSTADVSRLADAIHRFGADMIFELIIKK